jgi:hypothetical protein
VPEADLPSANPPAPETNPAAGEATRAVDRFQIFESVALDRLHAGSDSTKPASFLPLPVRLTAVAASLIAGIGVLWSVVARVPIQVNGTAAIVPSSVLASLTAATDGILEFQFSGLGPDTLPAEQRRNNALLSLFWSTEAVVASGQITEAGTLNQLVKAALAPVQGQALLLPEDLEGQESFDQPGSSESRVMVRGGTLLAAVRNDLEHQQLNFAFLNALPTASLQLQQEMDRRQKAGQLGRLTRLQQNQRLTLEAELRQRKNLYQRYEALWKKGFIPGTTLIEEQSRINSIESQLLSSDSSQLSTRMNRQDQLEQAKQSVIANSETRGKLENQLISYLGKTRVFAPIGGAYVLASNFANGAPVKQGDELLSYTSAPPALPAVLPVFLDSTTAQQVNEGMRVLLTPKGISRAQYGGIPGTVIEVSKLPLPGDGLIGVVGSRSLASGIQQVLPSPYLVRVRLELSEPRYCRQVMSRRCYRWSSGRLPPHPVRLATLADVQITTTYRRPIDFVMPALRRALGLVVDNP